MIFAKGPGSIDVFRAFRVGKPADQGGHCKAQREKKRQGDGEKQNLYAEKHSRNKKGCQGFAHAFQSCQNSQTRKVRLLIF